MKEPAEATIDLHVSLTADEVSALKKTLDHVRVHMAHEHSWETRDNAMVALGKVLAAAKEVPVRGSCLACLMPVDVVDGGVTPHPGPKGSVYEPRCVGTNHRPFRRT